MVLSKANPLTTIACVVSSVCVAMRTQTLVEGKTGTYPVSIQAVAASRVSSVSSAAAVIVSMSDNNLGSALGAASAS